MFRIYSKKQNTDNSLRRFYEAEESGQAARLAYTLLFGFFAGVLSIILKKESLIYHTGFLDTYTLSPVKYLDPDTGKLLQNILLQRLGAAVILILLSTTYLGCAAAYFYQVWCGLALGIFTAGSVIRYGMKGLLLTAGSLFPQQLILIPAFLLLSAKCCELCSIMYFRGLAAGFSGRERTRLLLNKGVRMGLTIMVIIIGCLIEAYVNPRILKTVLKIF